MTIIRFLSKRCVVPVAVASMLSATASSASSRRVEGIDQKTGRLVESRAELLIRLLSNNKKSSIERLTSSFRSPQMEFIVNPVTKWSYYFRYRYSSLFFPDGRPADYRFLEKFVDRPSQSTRSFTLHLTSLRFGLNDERCFRLDTLQRLLEKTRWHTTNDYAAPADDIAYMDNDSRQPLDFASISTSLLRGTKFNNSLYHSPAVPRHPTELALLKTYINESKTSYIGLYASRPSGLNNRFGSECVRVVYAISHLSV